VGHDQAAVALGAEDARLGRGACHRTDLAVALATQRRRDGRQRQGHVGAGVAVGDREDVDAVYVIAGVANPVGATDDHLAEAASVEVGDRHLRNPQVIPYRIIHRSQGCRLDGWQVPARSAIIRAFPRDAAMWFKNLQLFRLLENPPTEVDVLEEALAKQAFRDCGSLEFSTEGWVSPLGLGGETLVHAVGGFQLVCACRQEKLLPPSVVGELVAAEVLELERQQGGRRLPRRDRQAVTFSTGCCRRHCRRTVAPGWSSTRAVAGCGSTAPAAHAPRSR
jgi:hypothetical protein